jgi:capsular polysaccharide biosynthesis protein
MRFEEKRDAKDVSKHKKKNFNTQKRKRSYLTHWYKAVFGRADIKKDAPVIARLFLIAGWIGGPRPTLHIYLSALPGRPARASA